MPPKKSSKEPEPTDRATRSRTKPDKPQPKYTYSDEEESSGEEGFNPDIDLTSTGHLPRIPAHLLTAQPRRSYSPTEFDSPTGVTDRTTHRTLFHSIQDSSMSDNEADANGAGARLPPPLPVIQGVSPDMMAMIAAFQQQSQMQAEAAERKQEALRKELHDQAKRAERNRQQDLEQNQAAMKLLIDQMAAMNSARPEKPKSSTARMPAFDIDNDQASFPQWLEKCKAYIISNRLHTISDETERKERIMCDLTQALSMSTLKWLRHRDITNAERENPDVVVKHIEAYIKEATNPVVSVIELVTMKRMPSETADHLIARVHEKLGQCDTNHITDMRDYLGMVGIMVACEPGLRKRMYLDKVDTFAKASAAVKADEHATSHARMAPADTATVYATSSYKRDQKNDRSRSNQRSESKFGPCYRCGKTSHEQQNCYYKDKTCLNCDRTGHIAPVCKQPRRRDNSSGNANRVGAVVDSPPGGWLG